MFALLPTLLHLIAVIVWTLVFAVAGESLLMGLASDVLAPGTSRKTASPLALVARRDRPSGWQGEVAGRGTGGADRIRSCRSR